MSCAAVSGAWPPLSLLFGLDFAIDAILGGGREGDSTITDSTSVDEPPAVDDPLTEDCSKIAVVNTSVDDPSVDDSSDNDLSVNDPLDESSHIWQSKIGQTKA